jgi:vacuolar-type H+-ATPase subunit C/Vma6
MGNAYVNRQELEQVTAAGSVHSATDQISNKYYKLKNIDRIDELERRVLRAELNFFKNAYETVPNNLKPLLRCYLIKWEARYLKSVLAEKIMTHQGRLVPSDELPDVDLNSESWLKLKSAQGTTEALAMLTGTRYYPKLKKLLDEPSLDFSKIDRLLDRIFYTELNSLKGKMPASISKPAVDFINITNDITNIKILLRAKHLGLEEEYTRKLLGEPGRHLADWKLTELASTRSVQELIQNLEGTDYHSQLDKLLKTYKNTGEVAVMELAVDRFYLNEIVNLSLASSLTAGPAIRFIISKEFETRNLITVLRGLSRHMTPDDIMAMTVHEQKGVPT